MKFDVYSYMHTIHFHVERVFLFTFYLSASLLICGLVFNLMYKDFIMGSEKKNVLSTKLCCDQIKFRNATFDNAVFSLEKRQFLVRLLPCT